ncbi:MAG: hypothetical protein A2156_07315 [Deltaproteobacteria bacterium RBG_16_48_10]|nr:MAG: hypothetical protein A2156_07315 [Deltaproteobacteria bacterium RBG_16_48_10]
MKGHSIIALVLLLFSISLGTLMAEWVSAQEPLKPVNQNTKGTVLKQEKMEFRGVRDPFLLPQGIHNFTNMTKDLPSKPDQPKDIPLPSLEVKAILISDRLRLASIDRHIVAIGDLVHDERVLDIQTDRVILGKGDKKRSLLLRESPVRLTIEEGKRKGENR